MKRRGSGARDRATARVPLGKLLISVTAVGTMAGPYIFDFNETHIFNPEWTAHALLGTSSSAPWFGPVYHFKLLAGHVGAAAALPRDPLTGRSA